MFKCDPGARLLHDAEMRRQREYGPSVSVSVNVSVNIDMSKIRVYSSEHHIDENGNETIYYDGLIKPYSIVRK